VSHLRVTSHHITPCHIISHHITPHHTTPHHTLSHLNNRWLDLRVPSNNAIMRIKSGVSLLFRCAWWLLSSYSFSSIDFTFLSLHFSSSLLYCPLFSCYHVMSYHVMSCHVMSCHVMSCHVMSCHVISCHVMSRHVMPCLALSSPHHTIAFNTTSFYDISCQLILWCIKFPSIRQHDIIWFNFILSYICHLISFRESLHLQGFVEIQTPKIIAGVHSYWW
jgi:hypothetical protein